MATVEIRNDGFLMIETKYMIMLHILKQHDAFLYGLVLVLCSVVHKSTKYHNFQARINISQCYYIMLLCL